MSARRALLGVGALLALIAPPPSPENEPPQVELPPLERLLEELADGAPATFPHDLETLRRAQVAALRELLPGLGARALPDRERATTTLERIARHAGRPGAEVERRALCEVLAGCSGPVIPRPARAAILRTLERIGGPESVPALSQALADSDAGIRERARRALERNPARAAADTLRQALAGTADPVEEIALIGSVAARRDGAGLAVPLLIERLRRDHPGVARAAATALGDIGAALLRRPRRDGDTHGTVAETALVAQLVAEVVASLEDQLGAPPTRAAGVARALLRVAHAELPRRRDRAVAIATHVAQTPGLPAALRGTAHTLLARARPAAAEEALAPLLAGELGPRWLRAAIRTLVECAARRGAAGDARALEAVAERVRQLGPAARAAGLAALAELPGGVGESFVVAALEDPDPDVRGVALDQLAERGGPSCVRAVIACAATSTGRERRRARSCLDRLGGVDRGFPAGEPERRLKALLDGSGTAEPVSREPIPGGPVSDAERAEILAALGRRGDRESLPLQVLALSHGSPQVRRAAAEALARIGSPGPLPALLDRLSLERDGPTRREVENAAVALARARASGSARVAPIARAFELSRGAAQRSAARILGRLQGPEALALLREACASSDPQLSAIAVRALARWEDDDALGDLAHLAAQSESADVRVVALRGYLRIARTHSARAEGETFALVETALALAERDDERRLALAVLGRLGTPEAVDLAQQLLARAALREEAARALVSSARRLAGRDPEGALRALDVLDGAADLPEELRGEAAEVRREIAAHRHFVRHWQVSPPYRAPGVTGDELLDHAFPPEGTGPDGGEAITWTVAPARGEAPWLLDFTTLDRGADAAIYVRCELHAPARQEVTLEVGSDDGVAIWLRGERVHRHMVWRALSPGADRVDAVLEAGWNPILVKVVQGGGEWGFCLDVVDRQGNPVENLQVRVP